MINLNLKQARELVELFDGDENKIITVGFVVSGKSGPELYVFPSLEDRHYCVTLERK